jgi:hypothetical protein
VPITYCHTADRHHLEAAFNSALDLSTPTQGEEVKAVIVRQPGDTTSERELMD